MVKFDVWAIMEDCFRPMDTEIEKYTELYCQECEEFSEHWHESVSDKSDRDLPPIYKGYYCKECDAFNEEQADRCIWDYAEEYI